MKPVFVINTYKHDAPLIPRILGEIRSHHPDDEAIAILDGYRSSAVTQACEQYGVKIVRGDRLKTITHQGWWIDRYLRQFLGTGGTHLIRLDPDCRLHQPIVLGELPRVDLVCGFRGDRPNMGASILARSAAVRILESGLLTNGRYQGERWSYQRFGQYRHEHEQESTEPILFTDAVFQSLIKVLSLTTATTPRINAKWREEPAIAPEHWITHPHPLP